MARTIEKKSVGGRVVETKTEVRNGVSVGIVAGYIAAWAPDAFPGRFGKPDRFIPGAFQKSIQEHKSRVGPDGEGRQIRLRDMHGRTIGGFPINTVREDATGLFGEGEINLEVQQGKEAFSLARQGVMTDFSIGFISLDDKLSTEFRDIMEADILEGSIVDDPLNRGANILEVKSVVLFQDLPVAERDHPFDETEAKARLREFTQASEVPNDQYKSRFLWVDESKPYDFDSCLLPIMDVIEGKMIVIPEAVIRAAAEVKNGNASIPAEGRPQIIRHLERYFAKMDLPSPFEGEEKQFYGSVEVSAIDRRTVERLLTDSGSFSKKAAIALAARLTPDVSRYDEDTMSLILQDLEEARQDI